MTDDLETADAEAKELLKKIEAESEAKAAEEAEAAKAAEEEGDELVSNWLQFSIFEKCYVVGSRRTFVNGIFRMTKN